MGELDRSLLVSSMKHTDSHVRRQAILIRESFPAPNDQALTQTRVHSEILNLWNSNVTSLCDDENPAVRFQARLTLAALDAGSSRPGTKLMEDANDVWMRRSIQFSIRGLNASSYLRAWLTPPGLSRAQPQPQLILIEEFSEMIAKEDQPSTSPGLLFASLIAAPQPEAGLAALRGASRVWARKGKPADFRPSLVPENRLVEIASDPKLSMPDRTTAVSLLVYGPNAQRLLADLSKKDQDQPIRVAAITALSRIPSTKHWQFLIDEFSAESPPIRRAMIDGLLANSPGAELLLDAIEAGKIKPSEIDQLQVKRLTDSRDAAIKDRAAKLFAAAMPADRAKALADYQPVLQMKGDPAKGQAVFEKNCAACHRINSIGVNVAPDISDSRVKKYEQILADILQPNRAIDNNYIGYTVRQLDGTILTGILAAETATSITLKQQGGKEAVIPRSEIDELKSSGQSLMPEGLERQIPLTNMADLLAFIKNWRYLDGRTPLSDSAN
jgi:putative heme-binding domain-containing protein